MKTSIEKNTILQSYMNEKLNQSILLLNEIWKEIKDEGIENSQEVLDWLDSINEISVRN